MQSRPHPIKPIRRHWTNVEIPEAINAIDTKQPVVSKSSFNAPAMTSGGVITATKIVQTFDNGKRLDLYPLLTQAIAAVLERLFDEETHSCQFGSRLLHQVDNAFGCIAVGKEIIDEQHFIARAKIVTADTDLIRAAFSEGIDLRSQHILHRAGTFLLGKHYRQFEQIAHHHGRSDAARLDGQYRKHDVAGKKKKYSYSPCGVPSTTMLPPPSTSPVIHPLTSMPSTISCPSLMRMVYL